MVEGYLPIFNTDIIPQSVDADWQLPVLVSGWEPRPVLAIAPAFDSATGAEEQQQLLGILKAGCKLTDQQFHILQLGGGEKMAWHQLREYLRPNVVMLFNIHPAQLGIAALFKLNDINRFDSCLFVPSYPLQQLMADKNLKQQLWTQALKPLADANSFLNTA